MVVQKPKKNEQASTNVVTSACKLQAKKKASQCCKGACVCVKRRWITNSFKFGPATCKVTEGFPNDFLFYGVVQGSANKGVLKITFDCFPANENTVELLQSKIEPL